MNEISVRMLGAEERKQAAPFLFRSQQAELLKNGLVIAAFCDDVICGAAGAMADKGVLQLLSLFVAEPYRRRGVAAALLREVESTARAVGLSQISAAYSVADAQAEGLHRLFLRNGYFLPAEGETLFRLPIENLKDSYFMKLPAPKADTLTHIMPVRNLPAQAADDYRRRLQTDEFSYLSMQNAPGKVLPPLCLAYAQEKRVRALLIVCEADGCLHISGAYIEQAAWGGALVALLQVGFRTMQEKYPQYDTLTVTAANPSGGQLIERMLAGAELTRYTAFQTGRLVEPDAMLYPEGFGGVMARFNTITEELAARGIASRLVVEGGELPYLELDIAESGHRAELHYWVQGGESYEGFELSAMVDFPADGMDAAQRDALCAHMDETGAAQAFVPEIQPVCIRLYDELEEEPGFDSQAVIDGFILPYLEQAARCAALAAGG